jgi:hypothetical protein
MGTLHGQTGKLAKVLPLHRRVFEHFLPNLHVRFKGLE